jgi:hypothetical protein
MSYTLYITRDGRVVYWLSKTDHDVNFPILTQIPELKPRQFRAVTYSGELPADFATAFSSYRYVDGVLVKAYEHTEANARQANFMWKASVRRVISYKQQLSDLAALGLPTTSLGFAKLQALGRLSRKFLEGKASATEQQLLAQIAATCYNGVSAEFLAKEVVARVDLLDETLLEFMAKGNPL